MLTTNLFPIQNMGKKKKSSASKWTQVIAIILVAGLVISSLVVIGASSYGSPESGVTISEINADGGSYKIEQIDTNDLEAPEPESSE